MAKILVIEDDEMVAEAVMDALQVDHHTAEWAKDGQEGFERLILYPYDLAILDWSLPNMDGPDVCKEYRSRGGKIPLLMLTGKTGISDKIHGLDAGADDYLTKPFSVHELSARIRALLRRPAETLSPVLSAGSLSLDAKKGEARLGDLTISLLPKEIAVLEFLMRHKGQVYSANDLLNHVWSSESDSSEDAVRQVITRLRRKLGDDSQKLIVTVKNLGYKIDE